MTNNKIVGAAVPNCDFFMQFYTSRKILSRKIQEWHGRIITLTFYQEIVLKLMLANKISA